MRKFLLNIIALLVINAFASGQSNFVKCIVINNNGDSVYGNIDYRNWKNNPQTIHFKNAANEEQAFDASSIMGFYVPSVNEIYTSFTIKVDMLPRQQDEAIENSYIDTTTLNKRVFLLQLIMHPTLRLYEFMSNNKDHFYFIKGNGEPIELIHHYLYDESAKQVYEDKTYKEQLSGLFTSCPSLTGRLEAMKFRKTEIVDIIRKYLQCSFPGSAIAIKNKDVVSVKFGIVGGIMLNTFHFEGNNIFLVDNNYSNNVSPVLGVSLDIGLPRNLNKWHIVNELIYKSLKTGSSFTRPYGSGYTVTSDVALSFSYAQLNTIVRYLFQSNGSLRPYINLGIGNAFMIAENKNNSHNVYSFGREEDVKAIDGPNKHEFSTLYGAGLQIRNLQLELRYGHSKKSFSPYQSLDVNPTSYQFIITCKF
ncbi:MAG: hypothetical protein ACRDE8_17215 [Ginsengibacter sp.]